MAAPGFDLQPMSIGDMLDRTVRLYQRSFLHTLGIVAVPYLLLIPLLALGGSMVLTRAGARPVLNPGLIAGGIVLGLAFAFAYFWLNSVSMGALARSVSERYLGRTPTFWTAYDPVFRRSGALLGTYTLAFLIAAGAAVLGVVLPLVIAAATIRTSIVLFIVFGIVAIAGVVLCVRIFFRFFLITQVIVIEDLRGADALKRSWKLMTGNETRAFLISLFGGVVGYIVGLVLRMPTAILAAMVPGVGAQVLNVAAAGVAQIVAIPFVSIPFTLLYYDSRIRKEAFDLEMMARNLGASGGRAASPPQGAPRPPGPAPAPRPAAVATGSTMPMPEGPAATTRAAPRGPVGYFKVCPKCSAQLPMARPTCPTCGTAVPFRTSAG